jgi:hypothetical protein
MPSGADAGGKSPRITVDCDQEPPMGHVALRLVKLGRFFLFAASTGPGSAPKTERVSTSRAFASAACVSESRTLLSLWEDAHPEDSSAGCDWLSHFHGADEAMGPPNGLWL